MGVVSVGRCNVAETNNVKLFLTTSPGGIDWKQNRPGDTAANEGDDDEHLEKSQIEKTVKRLMLEDVCVGKGSEFAEPSEKTRFGSWSLITAR
jgi:hypothetical protein